MQLFAGLDVHSAFTYGTVLDEDGNKIREMKVSTAEDGFEMLFSKFPKKAKSKQSLKQVKIGHELLTSLSNNT